MSEKKSTGAFAQKKYGNIDNKVSAILAVGKANASEAEKYAARDQGVTATDWLVGFVPWRGEYEGEKRRVEVAGSFVQQGKRVKAEIAGTFVKIPWPKTKGYAER